MKKAIVLGATGLVGKSLIRQLINEEQIESIIAVTRRPIEYTSEKVINAVINFEKLDDHKDIFTGDMLFSCLGTTVKQAGSYQKQRRVDFDYQYKTAELASQNGVAHYLLVSSSGANANSKSPYFQMKGELENAIATLPFEKISLFQPSLLTGEREGFRLGEKIASFVLPTLCKLPPLKRYRPISGNEVAKKMMAVSLSSGTVREKFTLDEVFTQ